MAYFQNALAKVDKKNSLFGNSIKDFEIIRELGRGSYGTVYLVKLKEFKDDQPRKLISSNFINKFNLPNSQSVNTNAVDKSGNTLRFASTNQSTSELVQMTSSGDRQQKYVLKKIRMKDTKLKS
jgi:serine/threonine protein kinase